MTTQWPPAGTGPTFIQQAHHYANEAATCYENACRALDSDQGYIRDQGPDFLQRAIAAAAISQAFTALAEYEETQPCTT